MYNIINLRKKWYNTKLRGTMMSKGSTKGRSVGLRAYDFGMTARKDARNDGDEKSWSRDRDLPLGNLMLLSPSSWNAKIGFIPVLPPEPKLPASYIRSLEPPGQTV
jgi:hypothetical protein